MRQIFLILVAVIGLLLVSTGCGDDGSNALAPSRTASLSALVANQGKLTPEFDSAVRQYELVVPNGTSAFTLTATPSAASVKSIKLTQDDGDSISLKSGKPSPQLVVPAVWSSSAVEIVVTAEDSQYIKRYTVTVTQVAAPNDDVTLSSLTPSAGSLSPAFAPEIREYAWSVPNGTAAAKIAAVASNANALVELNGAVGAKGSGTLEITTPAVGTPVTLTIRVTVPDTALSAVYTISVSQRTAPSVDSTLSALLPSAGALIPVFAPSSRSYQLRVPAATTSIAVTPTATSTAATISIGGSVVQSGQSSTPVALSADGTSTKIDVLVTAEDPTKTTTYNLTVVRQTVAASPTIYAIGDSTLADYDPTAYVSQRGWGQLFPKFIADSTLGFKNRGVNGRSTKSYYTGGWDIIKGTLNAGDYVFIQFGHNDEKDGGIEGASGVGTDAWGAYHAYLVRYVNETRALGAIPVLFTPVVRLGWSGTSLSSKACHDLTGNGTAVGNADYPAAMRDVATTLACPLVDMSASSKSLVEAYGAADAKRLLYIATDDTHLQIMGATEYARLAVEGLLDVGLFTGQMNAVLGIVPGAAKIEFGSRYVGSMLDRAVSIAGSALAPSSGALTVTAPAGFAVSLAAVGPFESTLQIPYAHSALTPTTVYVRFQPTLAQAYTGSVAIAAANGTPQLIALTGTGVALPAGATEVQVAYPLDSATSGGTCTASGSIVCAEEILSGLYVKDYQSLTTLVPEPTALGVQRISILNAATADSWPSETDINDDRYVEFAISPAIGQSLAFDTLSLYAGFAGGPTFGMRVRYAKSADFANSSELVNAPDNASNALKFHASSPMVVVGPGETMRIRVYPYSKSLASSKYLALRTLTVHGIAY